MILSAVVAVSLALGDRCAIARNGQDACGFEQAGSAVLRDTLGRGTWVADEERDELSLVADDGKIQSHTGCAWPERMVQTSDGLLFATCRANGSTRRRSASSRSPRRICTTAPRRRWRSSSRIATTGWARPAPSRRTNARRWSRIYERCEHRKPARQKAERRKPSALCADTDKKAPNAPRSFVTGCVGLSAFGFGPLYPTRTSIFRGFAASAFGSVSVRTPSFITALIFAWSICWPSRNCRT